MIRRRGGMSRSCRLGLGKDWKGRERDGGSRGLYIKRRGVFCRYSELVDAVTEREIDRR